MKFTPEAFLDKLPLPPDEKWMDGVPFINVFSKGAFELEFFAPRGTDRQTPHEKDEFYIVVRGTADLYKGNYPIKCKVGDALFVVAGEEHQFKNMSDDFAAWVIFF